MIEFIIGSLMLLIIFQEVLHYKERKDLYSRLMAKDLTEYTHSKVEEKKVAIKLPVKDDYIRV